MHASQLEIEGKYNFKNQPERLVYIGNNWSGNGYWHQFEKVDDRGTIWCELQPYDLNLIEETIDKKRKVALLGTGGVVLLKDGIVGIEARLTKYLIEQEDDLAIIIMSKSLTGRTKTHNPELQNIIMAGTSIHEQIELEGRRFRLRPLPKLENIQPNHPHGWYRQFDKPKKKK